MHAMVIPRSEFVQYDIDPDTDDTIFIFSGPGGMCRPGFDQVYWRVKLQYLATSANPGGGPTPCGHQPGGIACLFAAEAAS